MAAPAKTLSTKFDHKPNTKCYAFMYAVCKELGICTACHIKLADRFTTCLSCYEKHKIYAKWYYQNVTKKKRSFKKF